MKEWGKRVFGLIVIAVVACVGVSGCGSVMKVGRMPDVSRIENELMVRVSARDDVLRVLGMPKGFGGMFLPIDEKPRQTWFYYYEESTLEESQRIFLFIFFDGNLYDGYMRFSSLPGITPTPAEPPSG